MCEWDESVDNLSPVATNDSNVSGNGDSQRIPAKTGNDCGKDYDRQDSGDADWE